MKESTRELYNEMKKRYTKGRKRMKKKRRET